MNKNRLEALSDGVIAIIITIMVLELHLPELPAGFTSEAAWKAGLSMIPAVIAYLLSFVVIAILWLNHHSLFDKIPHSTSRLVWHNVFLLFSMSLIPLPTAFIARHPTTYQASMFYGWVMFMTAFAFFLMRRYVEVKARLIPHNQQLQRSNIIAVILYLLSVPLARVSVFLSMLIFVAIPVWYFFPDKFHQKKVEP